MVRLITLLRRGAGYTREDFQARWLNVHAPLASKLPGLKAYQIGMTLDPAAADCDAMAELWYEDRATVQNSYASPAGRSGSADADANTSRREQALLEDDVVTRGPRSRFKLVLGAKRLERLSRDQFLAAWRAEIVTGVRALFPGRTIGAAEDTHGIVLNSSPEATASTVAGEGVFDGLVEIWAAAPDDLPAMRTALAAELGHALAGIAGRIETFGVRIEPVIRSDEMELQHA